MTPDPDSRLEFTVDIPRALGKKLNRVGAVLAKRYGRPCTFDEVLEAMAEVTLQRLDPEKKARPSAVAPATRAKKAEPKASESRTAVPSHLKIQALRRDRNQCTHARGGTERCGNKKRVDIFPVRKPAHGAPPSLRDIATLCRHHSPKSA